MRLSSFTKRLCFATALCMSFTFLQAQGWELGIQSGNWSFERREFGPLVTENSRTFLNDSEFFHEGAFFLHKDKGKRYLRLNFYSEYTHENSSTVRRLDDNVLLGIGRDREFMGRIGVEMGRQYSLGKKFRLMLGGEIGLGQSLYNRGKTRSTFTTPQESGYSIRIARGLGTTMLTGRLISRIDYRIGSRYRLGLAFTYGVDLRYERASDYTSTDYSDDGTELSRGGFPGNYKIYSLYPSRLSRPLISLSVLLQKPK